MPNRTERNMRQPRAAATARMGVHKDAYSLFTPNAGRKVPRRSKVVVTVDPERVAAAFAEKRDTNATRTATVVTSRPDEAFRPPTGFADPQHYSPVILPYSKTITR